MVNKKCVIIGQRNIKLTVSKVNCIYNLFENLYAKGVVEFYFGRNSKLTKLCKTIVDFLKSRNEKIKRIIIFFFKLNMAEKLFNLFYDDFYYSNKIKNAGKQAYFVGNGEVIDFCDVVVCYFDPRSKNQESKVAYEYAISRGKKVINIFE